MGLGSYHSDASFQMRSRKPHCISTLNGQVVVFGILLLSPDLGGNLDYDQEEGNSSNLSPNTITLLPCTTSVKCLRGVLPSHELYGFLWMESLIPSDLCQAVTMMPL